MTKVYPKVFAVYSLDRERDEALTARMSALSFIAPRHLDIPHLYQDEKAWLLAMKELHKINNYKARVTSYPEFYGRLHAGHHACSGLTGGNLLL